MQDLELLSMAREALSNAYAPYSDYKVGAALLTSAGRVFRGVNVENASYGLTICAERAALFSAVATGYRHFSVLAVVSEEAQKPIPCGGCLQVLREFGKDLKVIVAGKEKEFLVFKLEELLPYPFISESV